MTNGDEDSGLGGLMEQGVTSGGDGYVHYFDWCDGFTGYMYVKTYQIVKGVQLQKYVNHISVKLSKI